MTSERDETDMRASSIKSQPADTGCGRGSLGLERHDARSLRKASANSLTRYRNPVKIYRIFRKSQERGKIWGKCDNFSVALPMR